MSGKRTTVFPLAPIVSRLFELIRHSDCYGLVCPWFSLQKRTGKYDLLVLGFSLWVPITGLLRPEIEVFFFFRFDLPTERRPRRRSSSGGGRKKSDVPSDGS